MSELHPAMRLLGAGIPLSLLLDLASPDGPDTRGIMAAEARDAEAELTVGPRELAGSLTTVAGGLLPETA